MYNADISTYDSRKAEWEGISIEKWEPAKWKQWKAKNPAADNFAKIEREYLRIKYAIQVANSALSLERVKVKVKLTSAKSIGLQGTFPCKVGDVGKNGSTNKQYTISLGFAGNDLGVKAAVAKARELDLLLITNQFQWTSELLGKQSQNYQNKFLSEDNKPDKLIGELIQKYEQEFWKTHVRNRQGLRTWDTHYLRHLKKLPQDMPLSLDVLEDALEKTKPNTSSRFFLSWQLKKFCDFCDFDGVKIVNSYATPKPNPAIRTIPLDEEIIEGFNLIGCPLSPFASKDNITFPEQWQWAYGMLATYGLRPHELFAVDLDAFTGSENTFHLLRLNPSLTEGTKTGERICGVPPIHPHWVELFDLKNVKPPVTGGTLSNQAAKVHIRFRNVNLDFRPYDLRHAFAIRGHRLQVPIKTMADYMGHSVQEHTKTYQRWMSEDANLEIYKEVVINRMGGSRGAMKEKIRELEADILALKGENDVLKGILHQHGLGEFLE
ncbi:site-specific integrase [Brunnivagina elsteri]|uniref:Integrase n=1 Tax=Brunnivagina elsteri CCALA 953 TaxID=987040 RepID=A0A2A2TC20_9CYAN|nr:integrase [Calothrix elsteri]PAX51186.1 integrase [Calothrix elsteri CCALA 953]